MPDHRFVQRLYTLVSLDGGAGMALAVQAYEAHLAAGGAAEPTFDALRAATPGTATFVKLQRTLMSELRGRMR